MRLRTNLSLEQTCGVPMSFESFLLRHVCKYSERLASRVRLARFGKALTSRLRTLVEENLTGGEMVQGFPK